ncbi:MAG TPA: metalloregulator ArsR/SmtB family transcription factor [Candidatus Eisenbacteria bacterium]|nr:metalloregulator ArsR/SmtB family transcription factor [Candidatus Eisenbacteria bacterium]
MKPARARNNIESSAPIFDALGDPTRLRLVARLSRGGPQSIAGLTRGTTLTRQGITKHLRVLAGAGIVRGTRHGRESRWKLERKQLDVATRYLESISKRWDEALERLRAFVEE